MTEPIFFRPPAGLTLREIIALTGAILQGGVDVDLRLTGIAALDRATRDDLCFLDSAKLGAQAAGCEGGACLTQERFAGLLSDGIAVLLTREPYRAFVEVARTLFADALRPSSLLEAQGVAEAATVHPSARLESGVTIEP